MCCVRCGVLALVLGLAVDAVAADQLLTLSESDATIEVKQGGASVLVYNKKSPSVPSGMNPLYHRSGFMHPVKTPAGKTVTATFPVDHAHQHGIFSAWVNTTYDAKAVDFWNLPGGTGRVLHNRVVNTHSNDESCGFEVELIHRTEQSPRINVLRESWSVEVFPTDGSYFSFDIHSKQQALTDKPLVLNEYRYGGMALRGPVEWVQEKQLSTPDGATIKQEPSEFLNSLGSDRIQGNHQKVRWVALHGLVRGKPACITVLCHKDNFRSPQTARLHPTKPYFCFAPCVEGEFVIDRAHPLESQYRYLVTDSEPDPKWLDSQWESWCR